MRTRVTMLDSGKRRTESPLILTAIPADRGRRFVAGVQLGGYGIAASQPLQRPLHDVPLEDQDRYAPPYTPNKTP